jgi:hypothetical protein
MAITARAMAQYHLAKLESVGMEALEVGNMIGNPFQLTLSSESSCDCILSAQAERSR